MASIVVAQPSILFSHPVFASCKCYVAGMPASLQARGWRASALHSSAEEEYDAAASAEKAAAVEAASIRIQQERAKLKKTALMHSNCFMNVHLLESK
jgi:hypothetical protein